MKKLISLLLVFVLMLSVLSVASAATLKYGNKGSAVSDLQSKLRSIGYDCAVTGKYDDQTWSAVWHYQRDQGLATDGVAGSATLSRLGLSGKGGAEVKEGKLSYGSTGETTRQLQKKLSDLGYYKGTIDGHYGDATWTAVWCYQRDQGLAADGIAGSGTLSRLGLSSNQAPDGQVVAGEVSFGSKNETTLRLQRKLADLGYYKGTVDGYYGDATWTAVWCYQRDQGLTADGIAGSATLSRLGLVNTQPTVTQVVGEEVTYGAKGESTRQLQKKLADLGYYKGAIDGTYGDATWAAVWHFQRNNGLVADGKANSATLAKLGLIVVESNVSFKTLRHGDTGAAVSALQRALIAKGEYKGAVDGKYLDETWVAVWRFQRNNGLNADGVAGPATLQKLGLIGGSSVSGSTIQVPTNKVLRRGSRGDAVIALQKALKNLGYYQGALDGKFEDQTYRAVWWFQKNNKLKTDGVVGAKTFAVLNSGLAIPK